MNRRVSHPPTVALCMGKYHRPFVGVPIRFQPGQFALEKSQLVVADREMASLRRDDAGAIQHIAVQSDDRYERRIEVK